MNQTCEPRRVDERQESLTENTPQTSQSDELLPKLLYSGEGESTAIQNQYLRKRYFVPTEDSPFRFE